MDPTAGDTSLGPFRLMMMKWQPLDTFHSGGHCLNGHGLSYVNT